jgi:hypothetical protein
MEVKATRQLSRRCLLSFLTNYTFFVNFPQTRRLRAPSWHSNLPREGLQSVKAGKWLPEMAQGVAVAEGEGASPGVAVGG